MPTSRPLILRKGDRERIQAVATASVSSREAVVRAQIVLLAADGHSNTAIAKELGITRPTVIAWRSRYSAHGLDGLIDAPKPGRPRVVESHTIITALLTPPPTRFQVRHWNSRLLAQHLRIGKTTVQAAWKEYGVKPCGPDRFTFSTVPIFSATVTAVVDLHIGPQGNAIIVAVAPTPGRSEQAPPIHSAVCPHKFYRYFRCREMDSPRDSRIAADSLFVQQPRPSPDEDIATFCERNMTTNPDQWLHVIFNAGTGHLESVRSSLSARPNVQTHYTSTPTAWLHLADVWISIADRRQPSPDPASIRPRRTYQKD